MARIRTIKPALFRSLTVSGWPFEARWLFAGLFTYCDDEGRGLDEPRLIKSDIFPLDDRLTVKVVSSHLETIVSSGPICRYQVSGNRYLHVVNWREHQRVNRPTPSVIPPCPTHESGGSESCPTH